MGNDGNEVLFGGQRHGEGGGGRRGGAENVNEGEWSVPYFFFSKCLLLNFFRIHPDLPNVTE